MLRNLINKFKRAWKSRTIWMSILLAIIAAMQSNLISLQGVVDDKTYGVITFVLAIVIVILRFDTNKGLDDK